MLPLYFPPRKLYAKLVKYPKGTKFGTFTLLLPKKVTIEGELLPKILQLKMEDWDFNDRSKYLQFELRNYLQKVYYLERIFTILEPHQWSQGLRRLVLLNMLNVPHFGRSTSNTSCVQQLLISVHDGCLWLGKRILIDEMLIRRITGFPYQGKDPAEEFVGKKKDKAVAQTMKDKYKLMKKS